MIDLIGQSGGRLYWTCVLPVYDVNAAVDELKFARRHGAVGICLHPFERDLLITDPYFYRLFDEAQSLDMAVVIHIGNGSPRLVNLLHGGHANLGGWSTYRVPAVIAAHSLIEHEVGRNFPGVRWGIIEASASWIPWVCQEAARRRRANGTGDLGADPFASNNIWVSIQADDDLLYLINMIGPDRLVIGSDFGHQDVGAELEAHEKILRWPGLSEDIKRRILHQNALDLFRMLPPDHSASGPGTTMGRDV